MTPEEKKIERASRQHLDSKKWAGAAILNNPDDNNAYVNYYMQQFEDGETFSKDELREVFIDGMKSAGAREIHTKGMYSEEDLKKAFDAGSSYEYSCLTGKPTNFDLSFKKFIEQNKKKP